MNIFFTSIDPHVCAKSLNIKLRNKMVTESVQMLSTSTWYCYYQGDYPFDKWFSRKIPKEIRNKNKMQFIDETGLMVPCYINHPCNIWIRSSIWNYNWLVKHISYLILNPNHKSLQRIQYCIPPIGKNTVDIKTPLPNCTPYCPTKNNEKQYFIQNDSDVFESYKKFLIDKWTFIYKQIPTWHNNKIPSWFISKKAA